VICGKTNGEGGFGGSVLCFLCFNETEIELERLNATVCTEIQAANRCKKVLRVKAENGNFLSISMLPYAFNF
jgi:hypothetical protein